MKSIIASYILANPTLSAFLTGGVWHDRIEINRQLTPSAFSSSSGRIKPCILIKSYDFNVAADYENIAPSEVVYVQDFVLYFYTPFSSSSETSVEELQKLFNGSYIDGKYLATITNTILDRDDPSIDSRLDVIYFRLLRSLA